MREIELSRGVVTLVDDADFGWLSEWKWDILALRPGCLCAARKAKGKIILMHRAIMNDPRGLMVDHIDGDGLNNQKSNLRSCTRTQNNWNTRARPGCSSQFKGVSWASNMHKWRARITSNGVFRCLGYFDSELEAASAYNDAAVGLFGEFAKLNNVPDPNHSQFEKLRETLYA